MTTLSPATNWAFTFDPRTRWFGVSRSLIAIAQAVTLLLTPARYLIVPLDGAPTAEPKCSGPAALSAYCLGGNDHSQVRQWIIVAILLVVAGGYRPRWTALPHAYAAYSIVQSISLPDGGESVAANITLIILPLAFIDNRHWHWTTRTDGELGPTALSVSAAAAWAARIQVAYIYLDSAISKFGVADWANGSAEYYFVRDNLFGATPVFKWIADPITRQPWGTAAMSWGAIVIEIVIAVLVLMRFRLRTIALDLDLALHGSIILLMGLWSFSAIMIGAVIIAASPSRTDTKHEPKGPTDHGQKWKEGRRSIRLQRSHRGKGAPVLLEPERQTA
ncbi:sporulation-delaying protein SdpB family protein [Williamsia sp. CHRR-6]|uniref:sporulation-delaying protein SdpB family protein n=1 Tax=Williamsia sp. CHRR-6 TaxID=2835871 RepID=UPI001BDAF357|nr:sporulation-delaying protein SdpB family protein [Williamsia sp. CHRR-6]MBT0568537.1 hypothetical protein [Williamsia sp. CHRR-6]